MNYVIGNFYVNVAVMNAAKILLFSAKITNRKQQGQQVLFKRITKKW
jgi:hypothetical protein